jgi:tryptophan-rich sensory protein
VARTFISAAALCIAAALLEAVCAGRGVRQRMAALRWPSYSVPFSGWMVIGGVYYVICFTVLIRLMLTTSPLRTLTFALLGMVMVVNALWNVFFFRTGDLRHAFLVGLLYSAAALVLLVTLWQVDDVAASCFSPYVIYLFYANVWSYRVWKLNPQSPNESFL